MAEVGLRVTAHRAARSSELSSKRPPEARTPRSPHGADELLLMVQPSDGHNTDSWFISLGPGSASSVKLSLRSAIAWGYVLRVSLSGGTTVLATSELEYVVREVGVGDVQAVAEQ